MNIEFEAFKRGDQVAFNKIFNKLNPRLLGYINEKFKFPTDVAEDIIADTWYKLWLHKTEISSPNHLVAFMYTAVKNAAIDEYRATRSSRRIKKVPIGISVEGHWTLDIVDEDTTEERINFNEKLKIVAQAMKQLRGKVKIAVDAYFIKNMDTPQVSAFIGASTQTALNHKAMGIMFIKQILDGKPMRRKR